MAFKPHNWVTKTSSKEEENEPQPVSGGEIVVSSSLKRAEIALSPCGLLPSGTDGYLEGKGHTGVLSLGSHP